MCQDTVNVSTCFFFIVTFRHFTDAKHVASIEGALREARLRRTHTSQPERVGDWDNFVDNVGFSLKNRDNTTWNFEVAKYFLTSFKPPCPTFISTPHDSHNAKVGSEKRHCYAIHSDTYIHVGWSFLW